MGRDTFHQTRLLQAPSILALDTAREGAATASLGNLCQCLTTLTVKNFFLISNLNLPSFSLKMAEVLLMCQPVRGQASRPLPPRRAGLQQCLGWISSKLWPWVAPGLAEVGGSLVAVWLLQRFFSYSVNFSHWAGPYFAARCTNFKLERGKVRAGFLSLEGEAVFRTVRTKKALYFFFFHYFLFRICFTSTQILFICFARSRTENLVPGSAGSSLLVWVSIPVQPWRPW